MPLLIIPLFPSLFISTDRGLSNTADDCQRCQRLKNCVYFCFPPRYIVFFSCVPCGSTSPNHHFVYMFCLPLCLVKVYSYVPFTLLSWSLVLVPWCFLARVSLIHSFLFGFVFLLMSSFFISSLKGLPLVKLPSASASPFLGPPSPHPETDETEVFVFIPRSLLVVPSIFKCRIRRQSLQLSSHPSVEPLHSLTKIIVETESRDLESSFT